MTTDLIMRVNERTTTTPTILPGVSCFAFRFLVFSFLESIFFLVSFFFSIDLRLSCVCIVINTTINTCYVVLLGRQVV